MGPDSLYCGKWRKISKLRHDDLGLAMSNIEPVQDIFIYYHTFVIGVQMWKKTKHKVKICSLFAPAQTPQ